MNAAQREREARRIADEATRDYDRWRAANPNATSLEQIAEVYRRGNLILRRAVR